MQQQIKS